MTCDDIQLLLENDAPSPAEAATLRAHLATCADCSAYAAEIREHDVLIARALSTPADAVAFERLKSGLANRIDADHRARSHWRWMPLAGGIAATVLVCIGAVWLAKTPSNDPDIASKDSTKIVAPDTLLTGNVLTQVADLQAKIRTTQVLDELVQLQTAMDAPDDQDGKSTAEDAEMYLERILALHSANEVAYRETLRGVDRSGVSTRLRSLRDSLTNDAPKPMVAALNLAIETFDHAGRIARAQTKEVACAN
ncbi:MAG: hypothetical protein WCT04_09975 [Planctomycetota bacterium]